MTASLFPLLSKDLGVTVMSKTIFFCIQRYKGCSFILEKSIFDCNWTQTHNHLVHKRTLNQPNWPVHNKNIHL